MDAKGLRSLAFVTRCAGAASVAYQVATRLDLPESVWAVMSALIVSQERLHETHSSFAGRILGTLLGIAVTTLVSLVASRTSVSTSTQMAAAVALTAFVVRVFPTLRTAMWTCPLIFLTAEPSRPMFMIAVYRGSEVILGAVIGWVFHCTAEMVVDTLTCCGRTLRSLRAAASDATKAEE
jgi:uncharacterized membrane protein YccC